MRSLVAIRAHRPTAAVARLHQALAGEVPAGRLVVVVDELRGSDRRDWPSHYDLVALDDALLEASGLRTDLVDAGWRCGDYAYYALAAARRFDHAWLVEPDVEFAGPDGIAVLGALDRSDADLIAADIRPAPDWLWSHQLTVRGVTDPWRCFFPLTRLSRPAIDASLRLRRRLQWLDGGDFGHPNDEGIVATAVMAEGLSADDLRRLRPDLFSDFHHRPKLMSALVVDVEHGASGVVHPALGRDDFARGLRRELLRAGRDDVRTGFRDPRRRHALRTLETLADHALLSPRQALAFVEAFGAADAQRREYDTAFRRRVLRSMPADVRALVALSGALERGYAWSHRFRPEATDRTARSTEGIESGDGGI